MPTKPKTQAEIVEYINSSDCRGELEDLALSIRRGSQEAESEATVVSVFEINLFSFISNQLGLKYYPEKEKTINTERHISKGRIDSKYGGFIIEFKHPSKLKTDGDKKKASEQICDYLLGLNKIDSNDYLGLVTDGLFCKFVRCEGGLIFEEAWSEVTHKCLDRVTKSILLLEQVGLNSKNLIKDFCDPIDDNLAKRLAITLFEGLEQNPTGKTLMLFEEWRELFKLAHDDKSKQKAIEERRESLEENLGIRIHDNTAEFKALYSLQTAFAIIIKIIAYKVTSKMKFKKSIIQFEQLAVGDSSVIQKQMEALEDGAIFRSLGISNLLEGDFFSWYSSSGQWNDKMYKVIKEVFHTLTKYEDKILTQEENRAQDLFKELYERMIPFKVRHSLGEFYTPAWLADNVVTQAIGLLSHRNEWNALDPCAGSGTFITVLIEKILKENTNSLDQSLKLKNILKRVKAIDLNPLAVLTCRINYFINISHLVSEEGDLEIPVYLGDSSYVPEHTEIDGVECLQYKIKTLKGYLDISLPKSAVKDSSEFSKVMTSIEQDIKSLNEKRVYEKLISLVDKKDATEIIKARIHDLAQQFVELEKNEWNGIWARIVTNFLTTANLGKFDLIVGNPPWIDWKSLPEGYRERIKSLCISRHLFSGDGLTGGINLNICALIANVATDNWLMPEGILAFLMPQNLLFQQTYEGFRDFRISDGSRLYFQKISDWTKAGHPFKPVQHKFLTYFIGKKPMNYKDGILGEEFIKKGKLSIEEINTRSKFEEVEQNYEINNVCIGQCDKENTAFTYAKTKQELHQIRSIAGRSYYKGREGIEFYPQELVLLEWIKDMKSPKDKIYLSNYQNQASKHKIAPQTILLESKYLHPLIKGINIERFHMSTSDNYIVPFPYEEEFSTRIPIPLEDLQKKSPLLAAFYLSHKDIFDNQTDYNSKIIGKRQQEFYALARVGKYSFKKHYVCFRDNSKWQAAVISDVETEWGGVRHPLFQNHAVSMCEDGDGNFINEDEAHFICAILNAPITGKYILSSSDSRTFKIDPPIYIPKFDPKNKLHNRLSELSRIAHASFDDVSTINSIDSEIDSVYLQLATSRKD